MKSSRGKGAKRATVIIDAEGRVERLYLEKVNPKTHVETVLRDMGVTAVTTDAAAAGSEEDKDEESSKEEEEE